MITVENVIIAAILSPKSLCDLEKPRYSSTGNARRGEKGRGHAEHLIRVHIVYLGDYGSKTSQVAPCSVKTSVSLKNTSHS